jgi:hypothetical protein
MGKDHLAREQARLDARRGWRIAGPGLAALVLGLASFVAQSTSPALLWDSAVFSIVLVALVVWTAITLARTSGPHRSARTVGILGIAVAGLGILQSLGFLLAMVLLAGAV